MLSRSTPIQPELCSWVLG